MRNWLRFALGIAITPCLALALLMLTRELKLAPGLPSTRVFFAITLLDLDAGNATRAAGLLKGLEKQFVSSSEF